MRKSEEIALTDFDMEPCKSLIEAGTLLLNAPPGLSVVLMTKSGTAILRPATAQIG
jgi:hypothetical protein